MFTFDQLRGFVAVAEELHFGRAAERLRLTQPPLSRQIQKLERSVGVRLLDRDQRSVELTAAGRTFLVEARRLLALADRSLEEARRIDAGSAGTVRLAFTAASTLGVLARVLTAAAEHHPGVHLDLVELVTREQVRRLQAGDVDLGLARPPFDPATFACRLVAAEGLLLAVPVGHRLAERDGPVQPAEVAGEPVIMYAPGEARYFYDLVVRLVPGATEHVAHTVTQVVTMVCLVAGGRGVAFVPESAARLGIPGVRFLPLAGIGETPVELHLLWARDLRNPAAYALVETLTDSAAGPGIAADKVPSRA